MTRPLQTDVLRETGEYADVGLGLTHYIIYIADIKNITDMNSKEKKMFFGGLALVIAVAVALESYTAAEGPLLGMESIDATETYLVQYTSVMLTLAAVVLAIACKRWRMWIRVSMIAAASLLMELVYYLNYDSSAAWTFALVLAGWAIFWLERGGNKE